MSWRAVTIKVDGKDWLGKQKITAPGPHFAINAKAGLTPGSSFSVGETVYEAVSVVDFAQRGEILEVDAKESSDGESEPRRGKRRTSGSDLPDEAESGWDQPDRE